MRSTTIRDVARHAGVSIATVSRVMRDSADVRPDTRDRVAGRGRTSWSTRPASSAASSPSAGTPPTASSSPTCPAPTTPRSCSATRRSPPSCGRSVLILSTHGRATPRPRWSAELAGRCDGLVVLGRTVADDGRRAARRPRHPARAASPARRSARVDSVNAENHATADALAEHLLDRGRPARSRFVGDPDALARRRRALARRQARPPRRRRRRSRPRPVAGAELRRGRPARRRHATRSRGGRPARRLRLRQRRARARPDRPAARAPASTSPATSSSPAGTT